jgi:hypothetical protein
MIRYTLPAAVAALALGAPAAVEAQTVGQPVPLTQQPNPMMNNVAATGTIIGQPQPDPADNYGYAQPPGQMPGPYGMQPEMAQPGMMPQPVAMPAMVPVAPGSVWIPAHYNWDPASQNYVWLEGEFAQPPHPGAQWMPGRWQQSPTAWTWVDGHWN